MRRGPALMALMAVIALAAQPCLAGPVRPLTKVEARRIPSDELKRRVLEQLGEILRVSPLPPPSARAVRPLEDLYFDTIPRSSSVRGLCESDGLIVSFAPAGQAAQPVDTPVKVVGIGARSRYRFLEPPGPKAPDVPLSRDNREIADHQCATLDPMKQSFFDAPDDEGASNAAYLYLQVIDGLRSGRPGFQFECADGKDCAKELLAAPSLEDINRVDYCEVGPTMTAGCFNVTFGDWNWELSIQATAAGERPVVSRARLRYTFVLMEPRVD